VSEDARVYDVAYMAEPHCAKGQATVTADPLNVRRGPGLSYGLLDQLSLGAPVTVWAVERDATGAAWYLVQDVRGLTGWCAAAFLRVQGRLVA